jgi:hypothetical protein
LKWLADLGDLQRSYLLGYFDGDGSMFLPRDRRGRERRGWTTCSGSEQVLVELRECVGAAMGYICKDPAPPRRGSATGSGDLAEAR